MRKKTFGPHPQRLATASSATTPGSACRWAARAIVAAALFLLYAWALALTAAAAPAQAPLMLGPGQDQVEAWDALSMLADPESKLDAAAALADTARFARPSTAKATLGVQRDVFWLRIPVVVTADAPDTWVLQAGFGLIDRMDVYVATSGNLRHIAVTGKNQPVAGTALGGPSPALVLRLAPGMAHTVLLRVDTEGPKIVPVRFWQPDAFHAASLGEQLLQGMLFGLGFSLFLYSVGQWINLRDALFGKYALMVGGITIYLACWFGIASQYAWQGNLWLNVHAAGIFSLSSSCGAYLFIDHLLTRPGTDRIFSRLMRTGAALCVVVAVAFGAGLMSHRMLIAVVGSMGILPMLLGLPGAYRRARGGDAVGIYLLAGWGVTFVAAMISSQVINGRLPVNFWTSHALQFGVTFDMLVFMRILGLRTQAMQAAMLRAQASTRLKSEFLANMSHEIRTPMNAIIGMSRLALMAESDPRQRNYLGKILGASQHLLGVINDILDLSKIEAGKLALESVAFELDELLGQLASMTGLSTGAKGIELVFRVGPEVPQQLVGDPLRLGQVLLNLAGNAVKFTERGEIVVSVDLCRADRHGVTLRFAVSDTGIGMNADQLARLFQSFSQADGSTTRKYGGTGLGLSISKQLVELMQGSITVTSTPGAGSSFSFELPLGLATDAPSAPAPARPSGAALAGLDGARILLAEDNANNREVALDFLAAARIRVDIAHNGREAVRLAAAGDYDLVLMDIQMPELDGLDATREIRAVAGLSALPIVAMTAHASPQDRARSLAAGMNDHINKPIDPDLLFCTLLKWIDPARLAGRSLPPATAAHSPLACPPPAMPHSAALPAIAGVDWQAALAGVDGQRQRLEKRAASFVREYGEAPRALREALAARDYARLQVLAHNLKSSAAYVGAYELSAQASRVELDLRAGQFEQLGARAPLLAACAETVLAGLAQLAALPLAPAIGAGGLHGVIERLDGFLAGDDARAEDALAELQALLAGSAHAAALDPIRRAVEDIEYAAARPPLSSLARRLGADLECAP
ncbi:hybrid sensor histidine kinase/response regulator [Massilia sp. H6]|uniref:hybrid sensor histidine kinase/response regulator n=1 Tax=Massilia sp. H6 TaxID=2970464 RepID=UPI0021689511|nr:hybrid sensor histidine kinase/response regulator [Massilia sp. H6]UVW27205.1 ATP-binding protein [Massilia sp. H6]